LSCLGYHLVDQETSIFGVRGDQSLPADVGRVLVECHLHQLASQFGEHECLVVRFSLLKYRLDDIVLQEKSNSR
jgi:hypothetical protein